jgi:hypothetical protein
MTRHFYSLITALLLTTILFTYTNCGAEKALQSTMDNYFAVQTSPTGSSTTADPNILEGSYYRAFYLGSDVIYQEMNFGPNNSYNFKDVIFPGAAYDQGQINEKTGTFTKSNNQYSIAYTQEHCDPIGTQNLTITFTNATDRIQVKDGNTTVEFLSKVMWELPQTLVSQIGPLTPSTCQ